MDHDETWRADAQLIALSDALAKHAGLRRGAAQCAFSIAISRVWALITR